MTTLTLNDWQNGKAVRTEITPMNDISLESILKIANDSQRKASNPEVSAWVSASAGSGKTKVLTDRILRLLLNGEKPEKILCLTFTKTAAAEMSNRLFKRLSLWTVTPTNQLTEELQNLLGKEPSEDDILYARCLFAKILNVSGGMKIMNTHSFCQSILKRFPLEAGLIPSFEAIDDTQSRHLLSQSIDAVLNDENFKEDLAKIVLTVNQESLTALIQSLDRDRRAFENLLSEHQSLPSLISKIYQELGVSETDTAEQLLSDIYDGDDFDTFKLNYLTGKDEIRSSIIKSQDTEKIKTAEKLLEVSNKLRNLTVAEQTGAFLKVCYAVLNKYTKLKEKKGLIDYEDMILQTVRLLEEQGQTAWVLYKLDGGIDHILIDEAQDSNPLQWRIVELLAEEFFSGNGISKKNRTLFVVGDKKQSIYGFQGANSDAFEEMRSYFKNKITDSGHLFEDIPLNISFRSTQPVIDLVNHTLAHPETAFGVVSPGENAEHLAFRKDDGGMVEVWPLEENDEKNSCDEWIPPLVQTTGMSGSRKLALKITNRIKKMLDDGETLSNGKPIEPKDILILVRQRKAFLFELIKALKEQNLPIAGLDRIELNSHIAVQDFVSLARFLLLPNDDLSLAEVLRSPIVGISDDDLYHLAYGRGEASLWDRVRTNGGEIYEKLLSYLNLTDKETPFGLFSFILEKERNSFLKRLGTEALDTLDEFLNLCLDYEEKETPSLQGFLDWFLTDTVTIKRDLEQDGPNQIRIMTIHASKGLEAPIVFLPETRQKTIKYDKIVWKNGLPLWIPNKDLRTPETENVFEKQRKKEEQEYRRLLYVALTRARDRLYLCGFNGEKKPPQNNWYDLVVGSLPTYKDGEVFTISNTTGDFISKKEDELRKEEPFPNWLWENAPEETPRMQPISPSKIGALEEDVSNLSPLGNEQALKYGTAVHKILQILPTLPKERRYEVAKQYMPYPFDVPQKLLDLMENPVFAPLFGPESEAEVPLMGTLNGTPVSGQVDRLVIHDKEVWIIDYKTNKNPPNTPEKIPLVYQNQMNAYKSLLSSLFPDKKIRCFLLWTTTLDLMECV
ncbi:MAG: UvrD-helicase domain-containing protein [Alphaproteobacteria bacterium]|nr:UvrD-helicase domain-containing protein [Alphaproteobacteria bacterium]